MTFKRILTRVLETVENMSCAVNSVQRAEGEVHRSAADASVLQKRE